MATPKTFVIVGAGLAGAKAAEALRQEGFTGRVVLIGDEPERPYERPPLSKNFLSGKDTEAAILINPPDFYRDHGIQVKLQTTIEKMDFENKLLHATSGEEFEYEKHDDAADNPDHGRSANSSEKF